LLRTLEPIARDYIVEEYVMYAVLLRVQLDPTRTDENTRYLHEAVVPRTKEAPGL